MVLRLVMYLQGYTPRPWIHGGNVESVRDQNNLGFYKGEIYLVGGDDGR